MIIEIGEDLKGDLNLSSEKPPRLWNPARDPPVLA
jgi:hypothetical protein